MDTNTETKASAENIHQIYALTKYILSKAPPNRKTYNKVSLRSTREPQTWHQPKIDNPDLANFLDDLAFYLSPQYKGENIIAVAVALNADKSTTLFVSKNNAWLNDDPIKSFTPRLLSHLRAIMTLPTAPGETQAIALCRFILQYHQGKFTSLYRTASTGGTGDASDIGHRGVAGQVLQAIATNPTWAARANTLNASLNAMNVFTQEHPATAADMQALSKAAHEFLSQVTPIKTDKGLGGATAVDIATNEAKRLEAVKWLTKVARWWSSSFRTIDVMGKFKLNDVLRPDLANGPTVEWLADRESVRETFGTWLKEFETLSPSTGGQPSSLIVALKKTPDANIKPTAQDFYDHAEINIFKRLIHAVSKEKGHPFPYIGVSKTCCVLCEHSLRESGYAYRGGSGHLYAATFHPAAPISVQTSLRSTLMEKATQIINGAGDNNVSSDDD